MFCKKMLKGAHFLMEKVKWATHQPQTANMFKIK